MEGTYKNAIKTLYTLQSNRSYLDSFEQKRTKPRRDMKQFTTEQFLIRTGILLIDLDKLSIIHVAGTKGKGTTCALTESILRHHGLTTGFFSSPHLVSVRERIRINGKEISEEMFTFYFWRVYNILKQRQIDEFDMPTYFQFLTILMFNIFLREQVDVVILEVGIGGEYDCTNIIRNPVCVGITSLALEHTAMLGNTIEEIAYQKSGIFKPYTKAFTIPQQAEALTILKARALERQCSLQIVNNFNEYNLNNLISLMDSEQKIFYFIKEMNNELLFNAALAVELSINWLKSEGYIVNKKKIVQGLDKCSWPGRMQIVTYKNLELYLDGAHTIESLEQCLTWYNANKIKSKKEILVFNTSGKRDPKPFLELIKSKVDFDKVCFVPNVGGVKTIDDETNAESNNEDILKCKNNCLLWGLHSEFYNNFNEVIKTLTLFNIECSVLVTGSLHLVGAAISVLNNNS